MSAPSPGNRVAVSCQSRGSLAQLGTGSLRSVGLGEEELQVSWLRTVGHELTGPLRGALGDGECLVSSHKSR
jgi:hypothetical protein